MRDVTEEPRAAESRALDFGGEIRIVQSDGAAGRPRIGHPSMETDLGFGSAVRGARSTSNAMVNKHRSGSSRECRSFSLREPVCAGVRWAASRAPGQDFPFFASIPCLLLTTRGKLRRAVPPYRVGAPIAPASADAFLSWNFRNSLFYGR